MPMRRSEREIKDIEKKLDVLRKCEVVRIAFQDEKYPYIVPMNFGFSYVDGKTTLYLHCAREGYKLDLMKKNPYVGFEVDWSNFEKHPNMHCHAVYSSIIGGGKLSIVTDADEMVLATNCMMEQYGKKKIKRYSEPLYKNIYFLKLEVEEMTEKATE